MNLKKIFGAGSVDMLHGSLWDKILLFALQLALTMTLQQMYNTTDVLILGHFVGADAIAAVGNNLPIIGIMVGLFVGLSLGANVVVARYIGMGDKINANRTIYTALNLAWIAGVVVALPVILFAEQITALLGVPAQVFDLSKTYLICYMVGMPFLSLFNFEAALFRAIGDTASPLYALLFASILNVPMDLLAVHFDLGIGGVAAATACSNLFTAVFLFVKLRRSNDVLHIEYSKLGHFAFRKARAIVFIGLPAGVQAMVFSASNLVIQGAINSLGAEVMAASGAALIFELNIYVFLQAFGMAATTFLSQNYGAGNMQRCSQVVRTAMYLDFTVTIALSVFIFFAGESLLYFFTDSAEIVELALQRVYGIILLYFICVPFEVLSGAMRGFGYSFPPAVATTVAIVGERMLWLVTVFAWYPTFQVLLATYPISWVLATAPIIWLYLRCVPKMKAQLEMRQKQELKA